MANKSTVFQALDRAIRGNWGTTDAVPHVNSYDISSFNDKVIYRTHDKADYEQKKLELQQDAYLKNRWIRANTNLSLSAYNGLGRVQLMYRDADFMDSSPEIGAALDIVSEECVIPSQEDGSIVNVYSKSERVKRILEDLFVNRLNIQLTGQMVIRAMCKYGNQFMLLDIDRKSGVKGWKQLPVMQMERVENGIRNPYGGASIIADGKNTDMSTQFVWTDENSSLQTPFRDWQIAHFRLLNNSIYLPYGCLVGDTRIETENGYKEMSRIEIGDKVWTFNVNSQERELGEVTMFMPKGVKEVYRVKTKHYEITGTADHKLLTVDNDKLIYKRIDELTIGDKLVCDNKCDRNYHPVKINKEKPQITSKSDKWWVDYIDNIPEYVTEDFARFFGFLIGDGWLSHGYHVMFALGEHPSLNQRYSSLLEKFSGKEARFEKYSDGRKKKLEYHTCYVGSKMLHEILNRLGFTGKSYDKRIPNWVYNCSNQIKESFLEGIVDADGTINVIGKDTLYVNIELANEQLIKDIKCLVQSLGYKVGNTNVRSRIGYSSSLEDGSTIISQHNSYYINFCKKRNVQEKATDSNVRKSDEIKFERIKSIQHIGEKETYDFTVSNDNSNFFANGIVTHNCSYLNPARRSWRMLSLMEDLMFMYRLERSMERRVYKIFVGAIDDADVPGYVERIANEFKRTPIIDPQTGQVDLRKNVLTVNDDIFLPVRSENAPNPIDTLSAGQNMTALDDIKYVQNKVCAALRIPRPFFNFEEPAGQGNNLALLDIRFTRTINRIQQAFLLELTKIATIHLFLLGFDDELTNFTLSMNNPSTQAEQLQIDNLAKKLAAIRDAVSDPGGGIPAMSMTRALKTIMKWSEKEIKENLEEIRLEKGIQAELEKTTQIIKKTGIFDSIDRIYGEPGAEYMDDQQGGQDGGMGGGPGGGGGGPMGGGMTDFGSDLDGMDNVGADEGGDINGNEGAAPTGDLDAGTEAAAPPMEGKVLKGDILTEAMLKKYMKMIKENKVPNSETKLKRADVHDMDGFFINEEFDRMRDSLLDFVKDGDK